MDDELLSDARGAQSEMQDMFDKEDWGEALGYAAGASSALIVRLAEQVERPSAEVERLRKP